MMDIAIEAERLLKGYAPITVSVNTSASQLRVGRFVSRLPKLLAETGFPASHLEIEITESSFIDDVDTPTTTAENIGRDQSNVGKENGMSRLTIGIDLAKNIFQVHVIDDSNRVVIAQKVRRAHLLAFFAKLEPSLIGMEACGSAHHWARELTGMGH